MKKSRCNLKWILRELRCGLTAALLLASLSMGVPAQEAPSSQLAMGGPNTPVALTLKRAIELALQNSKDIQVAKLQASLADR